jgi:ribosomal-protein-alanine N-acetyltransferase
VSRQGTQTRATLVPALKEHAGAIAGIHARLFDPAWDCATVAGLLDHAGSVAVAALAFKTGEMLGFLLGRSVAGEAEILSIGVSPEWQRQGLGQQLLIDWIGRVEHAGAGRLFLEVAADNAAALSLYRRHGFRQVGRRAGYYAQRDDHPGDALILTR